MQLGLISSVLLPLGFDAGLDLAQNIGFTRIEIPCAGFVPDLTFGDPATLSEDAEARARWSDSIEARGLKVSAFALHGAPLSPDVHQAKRYREEFRAACRLASQIGLSRLSLLAGLPEGAQGDRAPSWVTSAFPPDSLAILEWQWEQRVVPYWREQAHYAKEHGCVLCFEMHGGDVVYNPATLLRLHEQVGLGDTIACNFDPAHLVWQGIDTVAAIRRLGALIRNVHAKDVAIEVAEVHRDGLLKTVPASDCSGRPWNARTVGYGNSELYWRQFVSALAEIGYDDVVSIEQDDDCLPAEHGLRQAATLLAGMLP